MLRMFEKVKDNRGSTSLGLDSGVNEGLKGGLTAGRNDGFLSNALRIGLVGSLALSLVTGVSGCGDNAAKQSGADTESVSVDVYEVIGGFAADDSKLDFAGALVFYDPNAVGLGFRPPYVEPFCSGSLVGEESVLTALHCVDAVDYAQSFGLAVGFALGADGEAPTRIVRVVDVSNFSPGFDSRFGNTRDVALVHLEEPIKGIRPVVMRPMSKQPLGKKLAVIGYGIQDQNETSGTRRAGVQTLRAKEGRLFEGLFGDYAAFLDWFFSITGPGYGYGRFANLDVSMSSAAGPWVVTPYPNPDAGPSSSPGVAEIDGGIQDGPVLDAGVQDAGPVPPVIEPPEPVDPRLAYAEFLWENVLLSEGYEAVAGGAPGDAQGCFGDSGGPLLRYNAKSEDYNVFGVVSGGFASEDSICDFGAVYATFGPELLPDLRKAAKWTDPCGDLDEVGQCDGNTAVRCTDVDEGVRRVVKMDCGLIGLSCNPFGEQVACGQTPF